ncbi:MAG TPA: HAMP domain-containing sensor histidine kinase [Pedobacter sp.]|nr:HAMP domain-containing sensor histidine kinase [Pedobacter sp.]
MIKLLDKPLKAFTTYALIVLLCSIPVYFMIIDLIWVHEINKHNQIVAAATKRNIAALKLDSEGVNATINLWNKLQPETKIQPAASLRADSTYNVYRNDKYTASSGYDRFQGLVSYFSINGRPYSLTVEANVEESYETIIAITAITVLFFIILLAGFIKLNKRISLKLWSPFNKTLERITSFDLSSHKAIEFEQSNIEEFEQLNASISKLVSSNVAVFRQQKEFTENASHELQTPLAIVQSKLDLLLQDSSLTAGQSQIIEETNQALSRISRINKNLLLMAKIETQHFLDNQMIDVPETIGQMLEQLSGLADRKTISSSINGDCLIEGNTILFEILLTNLLMNALRHAEDDAQIQVLFSESTLTVLNTGAFPLDSDKLFSRFSAASTKTPGSGLGLSIVKEICNRYGWEVNYMYNNGMHNFIVVFR